MGGVANLDSLLQGNEQGRAQPDTAGGAANLDDLIGQVDVSLNGPIATSAGEVLANDERTRAESVAKLKHLRTLPQATPQHKARIDMLIKLMENHLLYNHVSENRAIGSNLVRGLLRGLGDAAYDMADLLPAAIGLVPIFRDAMKPIRKVMADGRAMDKLYYDPQGISGFAGYATGLFAPAMIIPKNPYALASDITLNLSKSLPLGAGIHAAVEAGRKGTLVQRAITNLVGGLPVDAIQAASIPDASTEEKLKQFAINLGMSAGATLAGEGWGRAKRATGKFLRGGGGPPPPPGGPGGPGGPGSPRGGAGEETPADKAARATKLAEMEDKISDVDAQRKLRARAIKAWNNGTMQMRQAMAPDLHESTHGKNWKDLGPEEKNAVIDAFKAQQPKPAEPPAPPAGSSVTNTNLDQPLGSEEMVRFRSLQRKLFQGGQDALSPDEMTEFKGLYDRWSNVSTTGARITPAEITAKQLDLLSAIRAATDAGNMDEAARLTAELGALRAQNIQQERRVQPGEGPGGVERRRSGEAPTPLMDSIDRHIQTLEQRLADPNNAEQRESIEGQLRALRGIKVIGQMGRDAGGPAPKRGDDVIIKIPRGIDVFAGTTGGNSRARLVNIDPSDSGPSKITVQLESHFGPGNGQITFLADGLKREGNAWVFEGLIKPVKDPVNDVAIRLQRKRSPGDKKVNMTDEMRVVSRNAGEASDLHPWRVSSFGGFFMRPSGHNLFLTKAAALDFAERGGKFERVTKENKRPVPTADEIEAQRREAFSYMQNMRDNQVLTEKQVEKLLNTTKRSGFGGHRVTVADVKRMLLRNAAAGNELADAPVLSSADLNKSELELTEKAVMDAEKARREADAEGIPLDPENTRDVEHLKRLLADAKNANAKLAEATRADNQAGVRGSKDRLEIISSHMRQIRSRIEGRIAAADPIKIEVDEIRRRSKARAERLVKLENMSDDEVRAASDAADREMNRVFSKYYSRTNHSQTPKIDEAKEAADDAYAEFIKRKANEAERQQATQRRAELRTIPDDELADRLGRARENVYRIDRDNISDLPDDHPAFIEARKWFYEYRELTMEADRRIDAMSPAERKARIEARVRDMPNIEPFITSLQKDLRKMRASQEYASDHPVVREAKETLDALLNERNRRNAGRGGNASDVEFIARISTVDDKTLQEMMDQVLADIRKAGRDVSHELQARRVLIEMEMEGRETGVFTGPPVRPLEDIPPVGNRQAGEEWARGLSDIGLTHEISVAQQDLNAVKFRHGPESGHQDIKDAEEALDILHKEFNRRSGGPQGGTAPKPNTSPETPLGGASAASTPSSGKLGKRFYTNHYDPGKLGPDGNPVLIAGAGDPVTKEKLDALKAAGVTAKTTDFKPKKGERVLTDGTGVAIKVRIKVTRNGEPYEFDRIYRGNSHADARGKAMADGVDIRDAIDGFWTNKNRFVTRNEGEIVARATQPDVIKSLNEARKEMPDTELDSLDLESDGVSQVGEGPLRTIKLEKPLAEHTIDQLDTLVDMIDRADKERGYKHDADWAHDLVIIGRAKDVLREKRITPPGETRPNFSDPKFVKGAPRHNYDQRLPAARARELMRGDLRSMPLEDLQAHKNDLAFRLATLAKGEAEEYVKRMDAVLAEIASRGRNASPGNPEAGFTIGEMPTTIASAAVGFMLGATQGDTPEERIENGLIAAAGFGLGAAYLLRRVRANSPSSKSVPSWQQKIREKVISLEADPGTATKGFWTRVTELYTQLSRRSLPARLAAKALGADKLSFSKNFAKQAELFGLYKNRTEAWWFIKPQRIGTDGNLVDTNALAAQRIADMVGGDTSTLGDLMAAAHALEQAATMGGKNTGIDLIAAKQMFLNTPKKYHDAMAEARKYALALAQVAVDGEVLNEDAIAKFAAQLFYAPMDRIFKGATGKQPQGLSTTGAMGGGVTTGQPVKPAKGSTLKIRNPFESLVANTARFWKAYEKNRMGLSMVDAVRNAKNSGQVGLAEAADRIAVQIPAAKTIPTVAEITRVQELKAEIAALGGNISDKEALDHVRILSNDSLDLTDNVLWLRRNGKVEGWRLNDQLVQMFKSFNPQEMDMMWKIVGAPAQLARIGITASPRFVLWQAFRDNWQFFLNSKFGHSIPIYDQMRGWWANVSNSKEYQNFVAAGGSGDSIAGQGLEAVRTTGTAAGKSTIMEEIRRAPTSTKLQKIAQDIKELDLRRAYADIISPLADAGRVGNYLRGRGRGLSVLDAVYQTKMAGANYSEHGTSGLMRGLSHATLFLNPALQSIDATARAAAADPLGYTMRAFAAIALPSFWLWHAYKDDQEIKDLRQTEYGKKYWWFRVGGTIHKAPKPIFDGQLWGSSVESVLDKMHGEDPDAIGKWSNSLLQDASINLLPTIGVIPITYAANFDLGLGGKLIPESSERMDIEYQDNANTSWLARVASHAVAPAARASGFDAIKRAASPIGIEYLVRNLGGDISLDMLRTLSIAVEYQKPGYSVSREEAPMIMNIFPKYPSMNVAPIRDFYAHAGRADVLSTTIQELIKHHPDEISSYVNTNQNEIGLMELYKETRASLADLRAAIEDIRSAPTDAIPSDQKRDIIDAIMRAMIEQARAANVAATSVRSQMAASAVR